MRATVQLVAADVGKWDEWKRVTRYLRSARLAFARERNLWNSLELEAPSDVQLAAPVGQGNYRVSLSDHLAAVDDEETLHASVLMQSYTIAEAMASDKLGVEQGASVVLSTGATNF